MTESAAAPREQIPVEFSGTAGEYFRIWIVNIALTIVTLGIYSAWATVRTTRYFYTQTSVKGSHFDFHANPKAILIGRIIAVVAVSLYLFSGQLHPIAPLAVAAVIGLAIPWLVVRSRIFRLRNSSYRGIRFNFNEAYADAVKAYYGGAIVTVITLGFGAPTAVYWRNKFAVDNSAFGKAPFQFSGTQGEFYAIIWKSIFLLIGGGVAVTLLTAALTMLLPGGEIEDDTAVGIALQSVLTSAFLLMYLGIGVYAQVRIRNYVWNKTMLGENSFVSTLSVRAMFWIYLSNIIAIVFSLGLLVPWAKVRVARYRAANTSVIAADDWERYVAADQQAGSALGDEIGEAFDVGSGIGI